MSNLKLNWLIENHQNIEWQLLCPAVNQPFKPPLADKVLLSLSTDPTILRKYSELRGLVDGLEVITIRLHNSTALGESSEVKALTTQQISSYLNQREVSDLLTVQLQKQSDQYREELAKRGIK
ncbi:MAG: hypothetical protein KDD53_09350 [Bdellovibrionales bacterium]|nr:hypothetical protein [Bdellovibrionales bacterium]